MDTIPSRINKLTSEQKSLLLQRLQQKRSHQHTAIMPRAGNRERLPLSFTQQGLWLHDQVESMGYLYAVPLALRLKGPLRADVLEASLQEIVRRHEILRTTFIVCEGKPCQVIASALALKLTLMNVEATTQEACETQLLSLLHDEARRPFDLQRGPLLRATLFRMQPQEHVLLLTLHHIVCDGWARGVLFHELTLLYNAFLAGKQSPLLALPIQSADFALWQRQQDQGGAFDAHIAYWRTHLAGAPAQLTLPLDAPRPPVQTYAGSRQHFSLPPAVVEPLKHLSEQERCTLFMLLLAAFQVLLSRYSGQDDIVVGVPIAQRTRPEIEKLIGFFVNTLAMRTDLTGAPSFRQVLQHVRETALAAFAHQELPLERLVEILQPQRDLSFSPLFQVAFVLQNAPMSAVELKDVAAEPLDLDLGVTQFDLTLAVSETADGLSGFFEYNRDLFTAATIERLAAHWQVLLMGIIANPEQSVAHLPLLTDHERQLLLVDWNAHVAEYPRLCMHQVFEQQVQQRPEKTAVVFRGEQLTYDELNRRANQLAHYLQKSGVGPEVPVGLCLERSLEMLIGVLGILKAGCAYVPLDPAYPQKRLQFMLEDAGVSCVLTQEQLKPRLPVEHIICLDTHWPEIAHEATGNPQSEVRGDSLAYIIYTSGSTGNPKGVLIQHEGVVNYCSTLIPLLKMHAEDHVLQFSTINFDAAVHEIFTTLFSGATLYICPPEQQLPVEPILTCLREHAISVLTLPPSVLTLLPTNDLPYLRVVGAAGEVCTEEIVSRWTPGRHFFNLYGPTETTIGVTCAADLPIGLKPPIGRALPNRRLYVLDTRQQPVPIGVPGELCIGGPGLARGYLHQAELTIEKFIPDPFSTEPEARLYRSGDLVRYQPDGTIEVLGRLDQQIKLRGYRIELGEIESALLQHETVRECVVLARAHTTGDRQLVAYVTLKDGQTFSATALRSFLKESLPEYMVPATFILLEAFPLHLNGKVDRHALPAPNTSSQSVEDAYIAPQTTQEHEIAAAWQEVLGLEKVGLHDNFFDLGGHSLLMAQLHYRLQTSLQRDFSLLDLFKYPSVSSLARYLRQQDLSQDQSVMDQEHLQEGKERRKQRLARLKAER